MKGRGKTRAGALTLAAALAVGMVTGMADGAIADPCTDLLGQIVYPVSIQEAMKRVSKAGFSRKDEYETTAAFEERLAKIGAALPESFMIEAPLDRSQLTYDADAGRLLVGSDAMTGRPIVYESYFSGDETSLGVDLGVSPYPIDIVFPVEERDLGTYEASIGVTVEVSLDIRRAVFDRAERSDGDLFIDMPRVLDRPPIFAIDMAVEAAKRFKNEARAMIVAEPKKPFYARGTDKREATIDRPYEFKERLEVMIADITCAAILDGAGTVVAARVTR